MCIAPLIQYHSFLGAISGRPDSLDYDSGARDLMSPEPAMSLQKMLESHDPTMLQHVRDSFPESQGFLDLANRVSLLFLTCLQQRQGLQQYQVYLDIRPCSSPESKTHR